MRAPLSWLRDYAPLDADVDRLADTLSSLGLVVEGVEHAGADLHGVVVGRVLAIKPHPDAERVRLVDVDAGGGEAVQVVCGAWNFAEGDLVPLAPVGTVLPTGMEIGRRKIRGQQSEGMLCSAPELALPDPGGAPATGENRAAGLLVLPGGIAEPGTPLAEALELRPDVVFDLDVSPNRPDALCMAGVARDLAAALGQPWSRPASPATPPVDASIDTPSVGLHDAGDLCPRLTATIFDGVPSGSSPAWMARRLSLAGMRPISAVVDVSNYVMLDVGQPNHAYDLERLRGAGIGARRARPGEVVETLDRVERRLDGDDCVICDSDGEAVGVAGVMGGAGSEIAAGTTRVLLEAAWFTPMAIARTGERLALQSDARTRFERGVDPEIASLAAERFGALLASIAEPTALRRGPTADAVDAGHLPTQRSLRVRTSRVNAILGTHLDGADVVRLLAPIGFSLETDGPDAHTTAVPSWRLDVEREIDVVEEVARMWGYGRIEPTLPQPPMSGTMGLSRRQRERRRLRQAMAGAGFDEAWTTSFLAPGDLERAGLPAAAPEVANPLDRSESLLRTSILPGLLKAVRANSDRQAESVRLFEIGRVFALPDIPGRPVEEEHLSAIVAPLSGSPSQSPVEAAVGAWSVLAEVLRLEKSNLAAAAVPGLHPGRSAIIMGGLWPIGEVGEVDPGVMAAYEIPGRAGWLRVSLDALAAEPRRARIAREISRFPAGDVDLAFAVPEDLPAGSVLRTLQEAGGDLLEDAHLFDVYRGAQVGEGRRSLAFRLRFRALDRTLSEAELAELREKAIDAVVATYDAELRG